MAAPWARSGPGCASPAWAARAWWNRASRRLFPMHDLALMGLLEVLPRLRQLRRRLRRNRRGCARAPARTCW